MSIKKLEEMNHYEVLNIKRSASQQEIQKAYIVAKAAYQKDSLAHYNLVSEDERKDMMRQIERAYLTLSHPKKRKKYDLMTLNYKNQNKAASFYRRSTEKLVIEDGERKGFWTQLKNKILFLRKS
ncbi:MAG: DnaJ domain-containing protein [Candidatus Aminicenantes bacterium]|jgi:DnaJ-class molecular chaperone